MNVTAVQVQHIYDLYRNLDPFRRWHLPPSQSIIIKVNNSQAVMGSYEADPHTICVSRVMCKTWQDVLETVAHEMTHLAAEKSGKAEHWEHGESFKAMATDVCKFFGWKVEGF